MGKKKADKKEAHAKLDEALKDFDNVMIVASNNGQEPVVVAAKGE